MSDLLRSTLYFLLSYAISRWRGESSEESRKAAARSPAVVISTLFAETDIWLRRKQRRTWHSASRSCWFIKRPSISPIKSANSTQKFGRGYAFLALQLNRAALSISANIAEGNGRFTKADRRNFFGIARGSVQECVPLLELARRRRLLIPEQHTSLKDSLEEIARMLSGLINGLDNRER